tara:strand:- start:14 stop:163 length:150 start_codon:yes stop_codon:yes gene_type:complete
VNCKWGSVYQRLYLTLRFLPNTIENGFEQVYQRYYDGKLPDDIFVPEHC